MTLIASVARVHGPHIDWSSFSPFVALTVGALLVLLVGLASGAVARKRVVPALTLVILAVAMGCEIWRMGHATSIIHGALRVDDLGLEIDLICGLAAIVAVLLSLGSAAPDEAGHGEYHSLLLFSVLGMAVLASAEDTIALFLGLELLSIPLYILCAAEHRREGSLESGLKYLVIGSLGSATLVYGLAMLYGATGQTAFSGIAAGLSDGRVALTDPLVLAGIGLTVVGFAFKASIAPFHQWTPDVYEGAPTPVTAFMATATKAAALAIFLRFFDVALVSDQTTWAPLLAALATITIIVGNVGALGQTSLKRMLGYSGVGQAGYMLAGVVVATQLGIAATVLYLGFYLAMNMAAFAVIVSVERQSGSDSVESLRGLGRNSPWLAWPLTLAMLGLAGIPGTVGFIGKVQLIHALVSGNYTWLAIVLVIGAMISLGYYLRVVATVWLGAATTTAEVVDPVVATGSGVLGVSPELAVVAVVFGAAIVFFGVIPGPLFTLAGHAGAALSGVL
jgi:NADH-quinone oxidoreductase subunit N